MNPTVRLFVCLGAGPMSALSDRVYCLQHHSVNRAGFFTSHDALRSNQDFIGVASTTSLVLIVLSSSLYRRRCHC
jgi:hypothetical protein